MRKYIETDTGNIMPISPAMRLMSVLIMFVMLFANVGTLIVNAISFNLVISVDGEKIEVRTIEDTVGEVLKKENITLEKNDEVIPAKDSEIKDNMTVNIYRVRYEKREIKEEIMPEVEVRYSSAMLKTQEKITEEGTPGVKMTVYEDKIVDGEVTETVILEEIIIKEPINTIKVKGTLDNEVQLGNNKIEKNGKPISELVMPDKYIIDENNVPVEYKYKITGRAAAYYEPGGKTATGKKTMPGRVAVNPKQIPYGTEMWVVSNDGIVYGYAVAEDTGGFAKKGYFTIDLHMNSKWQCRQWGDRKVTIYVLN